MKTGHRHIIGALIAAMTILASCGRDEAKVIPRKKMARIYAEMLVTDQWITSTPGVRMIADTSLVYEPILAKYGYDSEDYRMSIDVYMNDPERFARIFRTSSEILGEKIAELEKEKARLDAIAAIPIVKRTFNVGELVPYLDDEPYIHYYDSLGVVLDSATRMYRLVSIQRGDTLYDGIRIIIADSLAVADTLAKADSLSEMDSSKNAIAAKPDLLKLDSVKTVRPDRTFKPLDRDSLKIMDRR